MTVNDIIAKIANGSAHVMLVNNDTGEIILKTIWHNNIPKEYLRCEVKSIEIRDYEIRLKIE